MRAEVVAWGALTLLLFAAVLVLPDISLLLQIGAFVVLSFVSIQVYRSWFRSRDRVSDRPLLNRRAEQLIGRVVMLDQPIQAGRGRAKVDDAFWVVGGPDLPAGSAVRIVGVDGMTLLVQAE